LIYPSKPDVIKINRRLIERYGGEFLGEDNLINPGTLEWVLEIIQYPLFGIDHYPTLAQKAAKIAWEINTGHVFYDGNKRTSLFVAIRLLDINGYLLTTSNDELIQIALDIAMYKESGISYEKLAEWFDQRMKQKEL